MEDSITTQDKNVDVLNASVIDDKLMNKLKQYFTKDDQHLFVKSFYMYTQYHATNDYPIALDYIWEWLGFSRKDNAKHLLKKQFEENIGYKILLLNVTEQVHGGHNKETIVMNVDTFKDFCMLANTEKAKQIRNYYKTLEKVVHEYTNELVTQQQKELKQQLLVECYHKKKVTYCGIVGIIDGILMAKYGRTADLTTRNDEHIGKFDVFKLECVVECHEHIELEKLFKKHSEVKSRLVRNKIINGKIQTELIKLDENFTIDDVKRIMMDLKKQLDQTIDKDILAMKHQESIQERASELKEKEMEHQEKMLELHNQAKLYELEMKKLELEMKKLETTQSKTSSGTDVIHTEQTQTLRKTKQTVAVPKAVLQFDLQGNLIKKFNSIKEAAKETSSDSRSISAVCCRKRKSHNNFSWKHADPQ